MKHFHIHIRVPSVTELGAGAVAAAIGAASHVRRLTEKVITVTRSAAEEIPEKESLTAEEPAAETPEEIPTEGTPEGEKHTGGIAGFVSEIKDDIDAICEKDPAARSRAEVLCLYSGLHALMLYRVSHALHEKGYYFPARFISQGAKFLTGIEIHPGATIGKGLFIDHGSGVVIGETAIVGDNCTLYQGVTLGGTGKDTGKRHPTLGNNVLVGAGAKLLGNFTIGDGAKIAAGAVVLQNVPENCTAVGIPARVVRRGGEKVPAADEMDQTHIPDPVALQLAKIEERLAKLEKDETEADA